MSDLVSCTVMHRVPARSWATAGAATAVLLLSTPQARAAFTDIPLGDAGNYAVLYSGTGGHNLSITNVTINGNVGVGGTGHVQFSGPGTINGTLGFSAGNTGQYSNSNASNVGPSSVTYNVGAITTDLAYLSGLSSGYTGGTNVAISGDTTLNESAGQLETVNGVAARVFNVTSYSENNNNTVTINGDGSGAPVVFDFGFSSNVNLSGAVAFSGSGLTEADQVLWNFQTSGKNINLNNNASSGFGPFQGTILAMNDALSLTNANMVGRLFGGDSSDMQIVSGTTLSVPTHKVPEPGGLSLLLSGLGLFGFLEWCRRRGRPV